jgi:hypothetical protein
MSRTNFQTLFAGATLALGGVMVALGFLIRPVAVHQNFQIENFIEIVPAMTIWIRSFQILVFGLFIRLAGLVALGTLHRNSPCRIVVFPAIAICSAALLVSALSEGYYMHVGAWGAFELQNASESVRESFLNNIRPLSEWVSCLERMGNMFYCFGAVVLGYGLMRGELVGKWLGAAAALIGMIGMSLLMLYPNSIAAFKPATAYLPISIAISLWYVALGIAVILGVKENLES